MDQENKKSNIAGYVAFALVVLVAGYYVGGKYGFDIFKTQNQKQLEISEVEKTLNENLDKGLTSTVGGRVLAVDMVNRSIRFADQTLGVIRKAPGGIVERIILTDDRTLFVREEVVDGPHFLISLDRAQVGQYITVYLAKSEFQASNAVAKEVIVHEYIPLQK